HQLLRLTLYQKECEVLVNKDKRENIVYLKKPIVEPKKLGLRDEKHESFFQRIQVNLLASKSVTPASGMFK
ncbi:hypothetical protein HispidOSU_027537, partial [Sigmodon hispidus]